MTDDVFTRSSRLRATARQQLARARALRKPLAKISNMCGLGEHAWCPGVAYLDPRRLSRRTICSCSCKHPHLEARSA